MFEVIGQEGDRCKIELESYCVNEEPEKSGSATFIVGMNPAEVPRKYALYQNYPNPFNPATSIRYDLPEAGEVVLTIYNMRGERVAKLVDGHKEAGHYSVVWNGQDNNGNLVASGIYFYEVRAGAFLETKKMVFIR